MAATTITRTTWVDDSGAGTDGTIINNAQLQLIYDKIDALLAANLTLGGGLTLDAGRLAFPAAQNASANANTLDDYEEGVWVPTVSVGALTYPEGAHYIKIGQFVLATCAIVFPVTASGLQVQVAGFPFVNGATQYAGCIGYTNAGIEFSILLMNGQSFVQFWSNAAGALAFSTFSGKDVRFTVAYRAAS